MTVFKILNRNWKKIEVEKVSYKYFAYTGACVYMIKVCDVVAYVGVTKCFNFRMNSHYFLRAILDKKAKKHKVEVWYYDFKNKNCEIEKILLLYFRPILSYVPGDKQNKKLNWYPNRFKELFNQVMIKNKLVNSDFIIDKIIKAL